MNFSNLVHLNSTSGLTSRISDTFNVYVVPILLVLGVIQKLISIKIILKILKQKENYGNLYYYMLIYEIIDIFIAVFTSFAALFRCGNMCLLGYKYTTKLLDIIFFYLNNAMLTFQALIEISFAVERIQAFSAKKSVKKNFITKMLLLAAFALLLASPNYLITRTVEPMGVLDKTNEILYEITTNKFARNELWSIILSITALIRGPFLYLILLILNIIVFYKFKIFIRSKKEILKKTSIAILKSFRIEKLEESLNEVRYEKIKETRQVRILLIMSINTLVGNVSLSTAPILFLALTNRSEFYGKFIVISSLIAILSHETSIVFYSIYNALYRKTLLQIISKW